MLFTQLLLRVAQVCFGLAGHDRARGSDLALDGGQCLARGFAHRAGHARDLDAGRGAPAELLDPLGNAALVVTRLRQMLAQPLLVGLLLGERDMGREVGLKFGFLGVGFVEPLHQLGVALVRAISVRHSVSSSLIDSASRCRWSYEARAGLRSGLSGGADGCSRRAARRRVPLALPNSAGR